MAAAVAAGRGKASAAVATDEPEMPEHDLEPPKFSRQALQTLLSNWRALKAMILTGSKHSTQKKNAGNSQMCEEQAFLTSQSGTALLDKFTHCLLVKCSGEMLDVLLDTIIRQLASPELTLEGRDEARLVARRFVRSVTRIYVVFNVELSPTQSKKKSLQSAAQPLQRCKRVFQVCSARIISKIFYSGPWI